MMMPSTTQTPMMMTDDAFLEHGAGVGVGQLLAGPGAVHWPSPWSFSWAATIVGRGRVAQLDHQRAARGPVSAWPSIRRVSRDMTMAAASCWDSRG